MRSNCHLGGKIDSSVKEVKKVTVDMPLLNLEGGMPTYNKSIIGSPFLYPPTECFIIRVTPFPEAATTMKRSFARLSQ